MKGAFQRMGEIPHHPPPLALALHAIKASATHHLYSACLPYTVAIRFAGGPLGSPYNGRLEVHIHLHRTFNVHIPNEKTPVHFILELYFGHVYGVSWRQHVTG